MNRNEMFEKIQIKAILFFSLIILFVAHATFGENARNYVLAGATVILISIILIYLYVIFFHRNSYFFLVIFYICLHFPIFLTGGGGLFNLVAALILPFIIIFRAQDWFFKDKTTWLLIVLLFTCNGIGYITGELGTSYIVNGFIVFTGVLTIFLIAQGVVLTDNRIRIFVVVAAILGLLNLFVTLNTNYKFIDISSPLIMSFYEKASYQLIVNTGTINTAELFGEWSMLNAFLLFPFIFSKQSRYCFCKSEYVTIILGFIASYICAFLSFSKAVIILSLSGLFLYLIFFSFTLYQPRIIVRFVLLMIFAIIFLPLIFTSMEITYIFDRFYENQDFLKQFLQNPLTAEGTTRELPYLLGLKRIAEQSWIFGNGFSIPEGNFISWFGSLFPGQNDIIFADFHNLYFCLIPILGFTGTFIFFSIFFITVWKLFKNTIKMKHGQNNLLIPLMIGLLFVLTFFLIDEYKTNAIRNSYFSVVLIWLGLAINANSIAKRLISDQKL